MSSLHVVCCGCRQPCCNGLYGVRSFGKLSHSSLRTYGSRNQWLSQSGLQMHYGSQSFSQLSHSCVGCWRARCGNHDAHVRRALLESPRAQSTHQQSTRQTPKLQNSHPDFVSAPRGRISAIRSTQLAPRNLNRTLLYKT